MSFGTCGSPPFERAGQGYLCAGKLLEALAQLAQPTAPAGPSDGERDDRADAEQTQDRADRLQRTLGDQRSPLREHEVPRLSLALRVGSCACDRGGLLGHRQHLGRGHGVGKRVLDPVDAGALPPCHDSEVVPLVIEAVSP